MTSRNSCQSTQEARITLRTTLEEILISNSKMQSTPNLLRKCSKILKLEGKWLQRSRKKKHKVTCLGDLWSQLLE